MAPGRVNLIGEHTDHAGGLSLPVAIDRSVTIEVHGSADTIDLRSAGHGAVSVAPDGSGPAAGWARLPAAVAFELAELGRSPVGIDATVSSDLPEGAGLASSGALCVAVALALCDAANLAVEPTELAALCGRAEHRGVGVPVGVMDHMASIFGRRDHGVRLDATTLGVELVPLPADVRLLVVHSGVVRALEDSRYGRRRDELRRGIEGAQDRVSTRRVAHLESENGRVDDVVGLLRAPEVDPAAVGRVMLASHASLRDDFEVSTPELDALVDLVTRYGAFGAKLTGAGFGGAIVALVARSDAEAIASQTLGSYAGMFPRRRASSFVCRASDGAMMRLC